MSGAVRAVGSGDSVDRLAPTSGPLIGLRIAASPYLWRLGPAWAVVAGVIAGGAPLLDGAGLLRLLGAVVLADSAWGAVWGPVAGTGADGRGPSVDAKRTDGWPLPYMCPGGPADSLRAMIPGARWHDLAAGADVKRRACGSAWAAGAAAELRGVAGDIVGVVRRSVAGAAGFAALPAEHRVALGVGYSAGPWWPRRHDRQSADSEPDVGGSLHLSGVGRAACGMVDGKPGTWDLVGARHYTAGAGVLAPAMGSRPGGRVIAASLLVLAAGECCRCVWRSIRQAEGVAGGHAGALRPMVVGSTCVVCSGAQISRRLLPGDLSNGQEQVRSIHVLFGRRVSTP